MARRIIVGTALLAWSCACAATDGAWLAAQLSRVEAASFGIAPAGRIDAAEHRLAGEWPLADGLRVGLDYVYTRYEYAGLAGRNRDLHRLALPFVLERSGRDWSLLVTFAPGLSASSNVFKEPLDRWSRDELTLDLSATAVRARGGRTDLLLGVARDQRLGRPLVYPLAGVRYTGERLAWHLGWPQAGIDWQFAPAQRLRLRLCPAGHRWAVASDETGGRFDYRQRAGRATVAWHLELGHRFALELGGGYEFGRRHRLTDDAGTRLTAAADDAWLVTLGLVAGRRPGIASRPADCR